MGYKKFLPVDWALEGEGVIFELFLLGRKKSLRL